MVGMTGESKIAARRRRLVRVMDFLEKEIWPKVPRKLAGRRVTKKERARILGFGRRGF